MQFINLNFGFIPLTIKIFRRYFAFFSSPIVLLTMSFWKKCKISSEILLILIKNKPKVQVIKWWLCLFLFNHLSLCSLELDPTDISKLWKNSLKASYEHRKKMGEESFYPIESIEEFSLFANPSPLKFKCYRSLQNIKGSIELCSLKEEGLLFGLFDEEISEEFAKEAAKLFERKFFEKYSGPKVNIAHVFRSVFEEIHLELARKYQKESTCGASVLICFIPKQSGLIFTATLGSSEAYLYRKDQEGLYKALPLSCVRDYNSAKHPLQTMRSIGWMDPSSCQKPKVTVHALKEQDQIFLYNKELLRSINQSEILAEMEKFLPVNRSEVILKMGIKKGAKISKMALLSLNCIKIESPLLAVPSAGKSSPIKLSQIVGIEREVKDELMHIVEVLKDPIRCKEMGARSPKGILLFGPTGVGKTLIGKAFAAEAKLPLFYVSGSDFFDKYAGGGASRLKELFEKAKKKAPCVVFIDRIDAIAKAKDKGIGDEQTFHQLLSDLDNITENDKIFVIGATNSEDQLDQDILQFGRLDIQIHLHPPNEERRYEILDMYADKVKLQESVDLAILAKHAHGMTGADLEKVVNQATFLALHKGQKEVGQIDLENSLEKIAKTRAAYRGGTKVRMFHKADANITFKDVAGIDDAREELEEIVDFLKDPEKFASLGAKIPKGVICIGPPGTGKTLMAKAVAGEADCPFFYTSGSEFIEKFSGLGASRIRDLFSEAKKHAPCIIFIDEIDAIGAKRSDQSDGGNMESAQTLNQLLVQMNGMEDNDGIIVMAATNRVDILDKALLRPGRFDRQVMVGLPDIKGREAILKLHASKLKLASHVDLNAIAKVTAMLSGADLANILNEAAIGAGRKKQKEVTQKDILEASDKIKFGKERKNAIMSEKERRATAFHEVGHVVTAFDVGKAEEIDKVSIIPRGLSEGATHFIAKPFETGYWRKDLLSRLVILMGGRAAEKIFINDFSSGAEDDIAKATFFAKSMVCKWGMSKTLGPVHYEDRKEEVEKIDAEVKRLIDRAYQQAEEILLKRKEQVERMTKALLDLETLNKSQIEKIMNGTFDESVGRAI